MSENVRIILTTRGRVDSQHTLNNLVINKIVTVVCHPGEQEAIQERYGDKVLEVFEYPKWRTNIDQVRLWRIKHFEEDYIIFIDDNLNFHARMATEIGKTSKFPLCALTGTNFHPETILKAQAGMFKLIIDKLKSNEYGIVGVSARSGNQNVVEDLVENTRVYAFWGINKKLFIPFIDEYSIDAYTFKGDLYTFIFLLSKGVKNLCIYKYAFDKVGGANSKGGCSIYRTDEVITNEAMQLKKDFSDFVALREKNSKSWNGLGDKIVDVTIYWKKAYEYGIKNKRNA